MNKIITIDLNKYPLKLIFAGAVILFSIIASYGENSHATELNKLPRNRTEITNIKSTEINYNKGIFTIKMFIDYIFEISLKQHYIFMNFNLNGSGFNVKMNPQINDNNLLTTKYPEFKYESIVSGNISAIMKRSKTTFAMKNYTNILPFETKNSSIGCSGKNAEDRICEVTNFCFNINKLFFFSKYQITFDEPFISFGSSHSINGHQVIKQTSEQFRQFNSIGDMKNDYSLITSFSTEEPLNYLWIRNVFAPLAVLFQDNPKVKSVYSLKAPPSIQNSLLISSIGNVIPISTEHICLSKGKFVHLNAQANTISRYKQIMKEKAPPKESKVVILISKNDIFNISNLNSIDNSKVFVVEEVDSLELISVVSGAKYILATPGAASSQAIYASSRFIEITPAGYSCLKGAETICLENKIEFSRIFLGKTSNITDLDFDFCSELGIADITNKTFQIDNDELRKILL